jgi:ATP-dependent Clp protease adapter protein ClpS
MIKLTLLLTLLLGVVHFHQGSAFATGPAVFGYRCSSALFAGQNDKDSSGGAAIAKPDVKIAQKTETITKDKVQIKQEAKVHDPISRRKEEFQEAPMFKLMLLDDESYDAAHVIERMCAIVEDMDEDQASTVFQQAGQTGKAMCGIYPFERAELFKEQLLRSDPMIFADMEEENK